MNVVDSSGWLECFADAPNADFLAPVIEEMADLLVPTICILEVFRRLVQQRGKKVALEAAALMRQARVVDLDTNIALSAAKLGAELRLPLADSVILATARLHGAVIWTQDADFKDLDGVKYVAKRQ